MDLALIQNKIYTIRNQRVMFDFDLAEFYGIETRVLKQAVRRNIDRFPVDFMFLLQKEEWNELITNCDNIPDNYKYIPSLPMVFTEQGVAMLSSVLKSKEAVKVNIAIIRAFVFIRQISLNYKELQDKINELEEINLILFFKQ